MPGVEVIHVSLDSVWHDATAKLVLHLAYASTSLRVKRAVLKYWSEQMQVSLLIVNQVVRFVEDKALGVKVLKGMRPDQQLVD